MKKETIYRILNKIEGLQSIEPDDEQSGLPYTVIVDGYEFIIKENLEIEYIGPANGILPEVSINKKETNEKEVKIEVQAKTNDKEGLLKIVLIKDGVEIETKEVKGESTENEFIVNGNGIYSVKVIGKNKRRAVSNEIEVTEINTLTATLQAGTIIEGRALLTITGSIKDNNIIKVEIYDGTTKIKEITYTENKKQIREEFEVPYMPFYEEKTYTAKLKDNTNKEITSNEIKLKNIETIKTKEDLSMLATEVNKGNKFNNKTINLIEDITTSENWIPIGYYDGVDEENLSGMYFSGTFEGNGHIITITSLNRSETYQSNGLFGMIQDATINNLTIEGNLESDFEIVGGIAGLMKSGTINHCIANSNIVAYAQVGGIVGSVYQGTITYCYNLKGINAYFFAGGICGIAGENSSISMCYNIGDIITDDGHVGGIVGQSHASITKCYNRGYIYSGRIRAGGIAGYEWQGLIQDCYNVSEVYTANWEAGGICGGAGREGYPSARVYNCYNIGNVASGSGKFIGIINGHIIGGEYDEQDCYAEDATATLLNSGEYSDDAWTNDEKDSDGTWKYNDGYPILKWQISQ